MASNSMSKPEQAVILCGGLGTRLRPYTERMPKPMIPCNDKPFLWYLLQQMEEQGIKRFILLTGFLAEQIEEYFKDGSAWGWQIQYSQGPVEWDTGKRIWEAKEKLEDRFLLLYSDNFVPFPMRKVLTLHEKNMLPLTFMISQKSPGNIAIDQHNVVTQYDNSRDEQLGFVEIGYMIVEKKRTLAFFQIPNCSFSSVLKMMASKKQIKQTEELVDAGVLPQGDLLDIKATDANELQAIVAGENSIQISLISLAQLLLVKDYENFDIEDEGYNIVNVDIAGKDVNEIKHHQYVYHISEKNENGIAIYCSDKKILSMSRFTIRTSKDNLPDVVSASTDE